MTIISFTLMTGFTLAVTAGAPVEDNPSWHPPIAAPIHYETTVVILADKDGVACVKFRCPPTNKISASVTSDVVEYQYRYRTKDGAETSGQGVLYENRVTIVDGDETGTVDTGEHLKLIAGHFQLEWSQGDSKQGWLYYAPETLKLQFTAANTFGELPLRRFSQ